MSGTVRIGNWLLKHGSTTIADWDREPACDGGHKITRLAARIKDLRDEGWDIPPSVMVPLGHARVAKYTLRTRPPEFPATDGGTPAPVPPLSLLGEAHSSAHCAIDDDWEDAA